MPRCYPASLSSGGRPETIPFHAGHRFRANPKKCPTCRRNGCPTSSGTGVQHGPEYAPDGLTPYFDRDRPALGQGIEGGGGGEVDIRIPELLGAMGREIVCQETDHHVSFDSFVGPVEHRA